MTQIYDISVLLGVDSVDYPGDTPYTRSMPMRLENGDYCNLSTLTMSAHAGSHLDAPAHFIPGGKTLDQFVLQDFIRQAVVVERPGLDFIGPSVVEDLYTPPGHAILLKTENSLSRHRRPNSSLENSVYLTAEAAQVCIEKKLGLIGIDGISIDRYGDEDFPVHRALLSHNILILEGLDLSAVPPGQYTLYCLPLKIHAAEASPVRAMLTKESLHPNAI